MISGHVAELAASYALGALGEDEMALVDAHVRACPSCARAVGSAESDVALIASMEARHDAPPELAARISRTLATSKARPAWALAAALLVGLLPSTYFWWESRTLHGAMVVQGEALGRLAGAHRTVAFRSAPRTPEATVAYASDGTWYVIVVRNASKAVGVAWMHDGAHTMLGSAIPRDGVAMLYLPKSHRMDKLALMDGSRIVAEADLAWGKTTPDRPSDRSG